MKEKLREYKNEALSPEDTEGVERQMLEAIVRQEQRQKWANLLATEGISRDAVTDAPVAKAKSASLLRYILGAAATVLLAFGMWWTMTDRTTATELTDNYLQNDRFASPSFRMGSVDEEKVWADAKNAYRDGYFDQAATLLSSLSNPSVEQQFYLALSRLYRSNPDYAQAAADFQKIVETGNGNYQTESRWFLALAQLKLGRQTEAKTQLNLIVKEGGWKKAEAEKILKKID